MQQENSIVKKLRAHDKRFDDHDKRFDDHDKKFDRVFNKLLEHDVKFDQLEIKIEKRISETESRILNAIDNFTKKTIDAELEQISTRATLGRHEKDITKVKKVLKIA
jgi:hypothetical protein